MAKRDTRTGGVLEAMVLPALAAGGYNYQKQQNIGQRFGVGRHYADVVATKSDERILISLKWQQVGGSAEQKVPFEVICLIEAVDTLGFKKAFLVLGGEGWKLREFFCGGGLTRHLAYDGKVEILTLEAFVARANQGSL